MAERLRGCGSPGSTPSPPSRSLADRLLGLGSGHVGGNRGAARSGQPASMASKGHFLRCSLSSFNNLMAGRLDPRAFCHSRQLFENRRVQLEVYGSA